MLKEEKRIVSFLLCIVMLLTMLPQTELLATAAENVAVGVNDVASNDEAVEIPYSYSITEDGTVTITGCDTEFSGALEIPATIEGLPVTSIGRSAFYYCSGLTEITIPESVISIDSNAFYNCSSLKSVMLIEGVTSIGGCAFSGCSSLTSITIPESVTSIGDAVFYGCSSLMEIWVSENNPSYASDAYGVLFNKDKTTLVCMPSGFVGDYSIPQGVTSIGDYAFEYCSGLTSVTIPEGVTGIGEYAFYDCSSLTSITLPKGVTTIKGSAFRDCSSLMSITISEGVTTIGGSVFRDCSSLTSVTLPEGVTIIDSNTFLGCSSLTSIIIPESVTSLGGGMFSGCSSLTSITLPEGITSIGMSTFYGCSSLTSITIPNGVTYIGYYAFEYCSGLTSITIPEGVTQIRDSAFYGCSSLTSITLPESVTSIDYAAFRYCSKLNHVIYQGTQEQWENITDEGGNSDLFDSNIHMECEDVEYVVCMEGCISTVVYCSLCDAVIGAVANGGSHSFADGICTVCGITQDVSHYGYFITENGTVTITYCDMPISGALEIPTAIKGLPVTAIGNCAFYDCYSLTSITIPDSVTCIGTSAFENCGGLTSITLPKGLTSIGYAAFSYCSSLNHVFYQGTQQEWDSISIGSSNGYLTESTIHTGCEGGVSLIGTDFCTVTVVFCPLCDVAISATSNGDSHSFSDGACAVCGVAQDPPYSYSVMNNGTVTITDCDTAFVGSLEIPATIEGCPVTSIGGSAFEYCGNLTSITLPEGVTSIGSDAFYNCSSLNHVFYQGTRQQWDAISIGSSNSKLTSATIHMECKATDGMTFTNRCTVMTGYCSVCDATVSVTSNGGSHSFADGICSICGLSENAPYTYSITKSGTVTITDCDTTFAGSLEIPATIEGCPVTSIGGSAFEYCGRLTSITLPVGVTSIVSHAFYFCSSLTSITLPEGVTSIGSYAFDYCNSLNHVFYQGTQQQWDAISIGSSNSYLTSATIHMECKATDGITFTNRCTVMTGYCSVCDTTVSVTSNGGSHSFADGICSICGLSENVPYTYSITKSGTATITDCDTAFVGTLEIPATIEGCPVTRIGSSAFKYCGNLTSITLPEGVTSIGNDAFSNCSSLTSITLPEGVTRIDSDAFSDCTSLTSITLPEGVTSIGGMVFSNCSSLTSITFPEGMTSIRSYAFYNCNSLNHVFYQGTQQQWDAISIDSSNSKLTSATIHMECKATDGMTFTNRCTVMTGYCSVCDTTVSVTSNGGSHSFADGICSICGLSENAPYTYSITKSGTVTITDCDTTFAGSLEIPATIEGCPVTSIGSSAFSYCSSLTSITLPEGVTSIGSSAFYNCSSLASITFIGSAPSIGGNSFGSVNATVYYDGTDASWTETIRQNYGGTIEWKGHLFGEYDPMEPPTEPSGKFMHVYVQASTTTARLGDTIDYTVYAYGSGVTALLFELRLPEGLSFVSGSGAVPSGLKSYLGWAATDWNESSMMWTGYNDDPAVFGKGTVILTFSCTAVAVGTYEAELFELLPFDEDYQEFTPTLIVDAVTVDGEHDYTDYVYNNDATCTANGTETATCLICGKTITRTVVGSALGHSFGEYISDHNATCTQDGTKAATCTVCNEQDIIVDTGSALGHSFSDYASNNDATCTDDGTKTSKCDRCGETDTVVDYGSALGHCYESVTTLPTCTKEGGTTYTCVTCGDSYTADIVPAVGHSYEAVITLPTCNEEGYTTYTCTACGDSYTNDVVPAYGHSYEDVVTDPTCLMQGFTTHTCSTCGDIYEDAYTSKVDHCYTVTVKEPTCTGKGYSINTCIWCRYTYTDQLVPAIAHSFTNYVYNGDATCTVNGTETAKCDHCNATDVRKAEGTALGHSFSNYITKDFATCIQDGTKISKCDRCNSVNTIVEPATGHHYAEGICGVCGATDPDYVPVVIPTLTLKSPTLEFKDVISVVAFYTAENTENVVEMGMITYREKVDVWNVETADYVIPGATYVESSGRYYSVSQGIHAKYLSETVYLACYAKLTDGSYVYTKLVSYSPIQYATNQLKASTDVKLKQLVVAMLNYGTEAQKFFGCNLENLANASIAQEHLELPEVYRPDMVQAVPAIPADKQGNFANNKGFAKRTPSVSFEGAFCINYFFTPNYTPVDGITLYYWNEADYNKADVLTADNASGQFKLDGSGVGQYSGNIEGIAAKDLSQAVYVSAVYSDGTTTWTSGVLGYSIGAYCVSQSSKGGDVAALAEATAVYGYYAKEMFVS